MLLACCVIAFLIVAALLAWVLVDHDYEAEYLALGTLLVRGDITLYQDEMTGQWMPLPFYFFGLSQAIFGPSLLVARLLAVLLGTLVVVLIFALAARWGGRLAGVAACGLFCTHGLVMGYFATAHFSPLVAALALLAIYILFCTAWPARDLLAMAVFSALFLVKPHYWPAIPFALAYTVFRAGSWARRAGLVAVAVSIPLLFFVWDRQHWKMLAYMPILRAWAEPMGYYSWHNLMEDPAAVWVSDYADIPWDPSPLGRLAGMAKSFAFFLRRYAIWMVAFVGLGALAALRTWKGRTSTSLWRPTGLWFTLWLFWYLVAWQFIAVGVHQAELCVRGGHRSPSRHRHRLPLRGGVGATRAVRGVSSSRRGRLPSRPHRLAVGPSLAVPAAAHRAREGGDPRAARGGRPDRRRHTTR